MKNRFLFLIFAAALLFSFSFAFGCGNPADKKDGQYTVTFELTYGGGRSYLKDENTPLSVTVRNGETLGEKLPELKPRDVSDDYEFVGWFYKDDNGKETEITAETVFSDMNVESFSVVVYAKLERGWAGPY
ncbi:MAG: hypothetical protein IK147_00205 [Clostridia bacterium]|nr:hypothetical protein [Clostridia bacterium]